MADEESIARPRETRLWATPPLREYSLALHGGAGGRIEELSTERRESFEAGLRRAYLAGRVVLEDGGSALDPQIVSQLLAADRHDGPLQTLTPRERQVLCLIAAGRSNKRIALELGVAEKTVKTHVGHVLAKLDVSDRTQAALVAVRAGLAEHA